MYTFPHNNILHLLFLGATVTLNKRENQVFLLFVIDQMIKGLVVPSNRANVFNEEND